MTERVQVISTTNTGQKMFWCPGCQCAHGVWTSDTPNPANGAAWQFNGDAVKPTISPSILVRGKRPITDDEAKRIMAGESLDIPDFVCHSFVRDGKIEFLGDCTHSLAGTTVEMEPL